MRKQFRRSSNRWCRKRCGRTNAPILHLIAAILSALSAGVRTPMTGKRLGRNWHTSSTGNSSAMQEFRSKVSGRHHQHVRDHHERHPSAAGTTRARRCCQGHPSLDPRCWRPAWLGIRASEALAAHFPKLCLVERGLALEASIAHTGSNNRQGI